MGGPPHGGVVGSAPPVHRGVVLGRHAAVARVAHLGWGPVLLSDVCVPGHGAWHLRLVEHGLGGRLAPKQLGGLLGAPPPRRLTLHGHGRAATGAGGRA